VEVVAGEPFSRARTEQPLTQEVGSAEPEDICVAGMAGMRATMGTRESAKVEGEVAAVVWTLEFVQFWRLSTKLCLRESCGSLEAGLEHGIELGKYRTDGPARSFPTALLQGGDS
jgi:hypothetical protein